MKRKIITYMLLSVFLFSTIGVPVTLHYCQMMNSVSFQSCGMCEKESSTCCKDDDYGTSINSYGNGFCCDTKLVAEKSNEKYISSSSIIINIDIKPFVFTIPANHSLAHIVNKISVISDTSPPAAYSNILYLNNSILLI
ncbi:MAG: hypothetical protein Q8M94_06110 [Ignavibacteria bacterium]|nr:hypothetical protein [Ignavibacteria bacterium]